MTLDTAAAATFFKLAKLESPILQFVVTVTRTILSWQVTIPTQVTLMGGTWSEKSLATLEQIVEADSSEPRECELRMVPHGDHTTRTFVAHGDVSISATPASAGMAKGTSPSTTDTAS